MKLAITSSIKPGIQASILSLVSYQVPPQS